MPAPRPVPSECVDVTPPEMWETLWELDAAGTMEMPAETMMNGRRVQFWKNHWFKLAQQTSPEKAATSRPTRPKRLPARFWRQYWSRFPQGHKEDPTERVYPERAWDDRRHGYWRVDGKLQYRSPDERVHVNMDGADVW